MAVERLGNRFLEIRARHGPLRQTLQQNLPLVQKSGSAIAALEREMVDESRLQCGQLAVLRVAFDGADRLAIEVSRRNHTGRHGMARSVGVIDDHRATQALRSATAELGAGQPQVLTQEIVHGQLVADVHWAIRATVDRDGECCHDSAPLSMR